MKKADTTKTSQADYQTLKAELDTVLDELQAEGTDIDAALQCYKRGLELTRQLETYLKAAENKVTQLQADGA